MSGGLACMEHLTRLAKCAAIVLGLNAVPAGAVTVYTERDIVVPVNTSNRFTRSAFVDVFEDGRTSFTISVHSVNGFNRLNITPFLSFQAPNTVSLGPSRDAAQTWASGDTVNNPRTSLQPTGLDELSYGFLPYRCTGGVCGPDAYAAARGVWDFTPGTEFSVYVGVTQGLGRLSPDRRNGWAQIDVSTVGNLSVTVAATGYETMFNAPSVIGAGAPTTPEPPAEPPSPVPLPASAVLLLGALAGMRALKRRG